MIRAVIVDDEKLARNIIGAHLKEHLDIEVIAECDNGFEGVKCVNELRPDLIFLDVQMPKLNGFEMLELLDYMPVIIFSTAFEQYAIKAFELSAIDYLLKPYDATRFNEALEKARQWIGRNNADVVSRLREVQADLSEKLDRLVVRAGSQIIIISAHKIDYIEAQDDYVAIYSEGKKYLKQQTMKYLQQALPERQFARVHRSYLLAIDKIERLEPVSKDTFVAVLKTSAKVPVSRSGYQVLRELLDF